MANDTHLPAFPQRAPFYTQDSWLGGIREQVYLPRKKQELRAEQRLSCSSSTSRHLPQSSARAERDAGVLPAPHDPMVKAVLLEGRGEQGWQCSVGMDACYI